MKDLKQTDKQYIANTYARFPVELVSGKGSLVYDENGKDYIDMGSGIGVTAFGIADDEWQAAVSAQLGKLQHMSNLYYTEPCALLAEALCEKTGMKKVFFCNSGAEAIGRRSKRGSHQGCQEVRRGAQRTGILHHCDAGEQFPRPHPDDAGRHRAGALPRTVPASDARLRPRTGKRPAGRQGCGAAE